MVCAVHELVGRKGYDNETMHKSNITVAEFFTILFIFLYISNLLHHSAIMIWPKWLLSTAFFPIFH